MNMSSTRMAYVVVGILLVSSQCVANDVFLNEDIAVHTCSNKGRCELDKYVRAIIQVESGGNTDAVSNAGARGLMQLTLPAVLDGMQFCNLSSQSPEEIDLHDPEINVTLGKCYLRKLLKELRGDWTEVLIVYNGGYRQLSFYRNGQPITPETANYVIQVKRILVTIQKKGKNS